MGLLPWTVGFLLCLAGICMFQYRAVADTHLLHRIVLSSISSQAKKNTKNITIKARSIYARYNPKVSPPPLSGDSSSHHTHQATSRVLHIAALFSPQDSALKQATTYLFYSLLNTLYGEYELFEHNSQEEVQHLFAYLCKQASIVSQTQTIANGCDLANIPLPEDQSGQYRHVLLHILKGGDGALVAGKPCRLLALPYFISVSPRSQLMSIFSAKPHVLMALFQREDVVQQVIAARCEIQEKLIQDPLSKPTLEQEFKAQFLPYLPKEVPENYIDFRIDIVQ